MMYPTPLNRLIATVVLCGLCLQGCRSSFQVTPEGPALKKLRKTSDDAPIPNQVSVLDISSSTGSDAPNSRLSTVAASATSSSVATSTVQVASLTHHLAVEHDAVSDRERAPFVDPGEINMKPAARPIARAAECSSVGRLTSLRGLPFSVPTSVFGAQAWRQYFGEVDAQPCLPSDIGDILNSACPFWPGRRVRDTHLLVLIPSTVDGKAFTLDLLGELVQNPRGGGHSTKYFLYDDEVQQSFGSVYASSSYWVLLTRDVLPGSRSKPYADQQALIATQTAHIKRAPYAIPNVLEAATAILLHYVRSGERLYEGVGDDLLSTATRCIALLEGSSGHPSPVTVGRFCSRGLVFLGGFDDDSESGASCLRRFGNRNYRPSAFLHSFGAEEWSRYFGEVEPIPPLPADIVDTLNSYCPFWPKKRVKDTHLLVLIPATVNGRPFSLNLLREYIQRSKGGGHFTVYRDYDSDVYEQFGIQSPECSYWVLMTRDVIQGSRDETYASQQALLSHYAGRTGHPYELPGVLEAMTAILSHYVRAGERLYSDSPWTYTRCQELVYNRYPVVVGGFSSKGIDVSSNSYDDNNYGVAGLWKFLKINTMLAQAFGARAWAQYFGEVGTEPPLPSDIGEILDSPCPFWPGERVEDTHLLVLIPAMVDGKPFSLNLLRDLIRRPQGGGYPTKYRNYSNSIEEQFGAQSPRHSYWVLMTRDVLEGSRNQKRASQQTLVAAYAERTNLPYELPDTLEAATTILSHYVRSGERLYAHDPGTYTRCQELVNDQYPAVVGGFSSVGINVDSISDYYYYFGGVAGLRKL